MTQHHPTTTPADTPAAPAVGGDDAGLNEEIARLLGWTHDDADKCGLDLPFTPQFDSDPVAALRLLAYVLTQRTAFGPFVLHRMQKSEQGKWLVLIGVDGSGESIGVADTLERAIAKACRDALTAIAGEARGSQ